MADNAAPSPEDDLSLPRAAVNKMIKEMIPMIRVSNDARELVLNCCTEFIHLIASEANEICNKQTKKTISPEHVIAALKSLGFQDYVKDVEGVYQQFKAQNQTRKKNNKMKNQGVSEEELLRQQQALFAQARAEQAQAEWLQMQQAGSNQVPAGKAVSCIQPIPSAYQLPGAQTTPSLQNQVISNQDLSQSLSNNYESPENNHFTDSVNSTSLNDLPKPTEPWPNENTLLDSDHLNIT